MTATFKRIVFAAVLLIAIAAGAVALVMTGGCSANGNSTLNDAKNNTIDTLITTTGVKERIDSDIRSQAGAIAAEAGIPQYLVDGAIDDLAIPEWRVVSLPENAQATGTYNVTLDGTASTVTTYDDPSVVTVGMYGQSVTMEVPASAQSYVALASLLQYL